MYIESFESIVGEKILWQPVSLDVAATARAVYPTPTPPPVPTYKNAETGDSEQLSDLGYQYHKKRVVDLRPDIAQLEECNTVDLPEPLVSQRTIILQAKHDALKTSEKCIIDWEGYLVEQDNYEALVKSVDKSRETYKRGLYTVNGIVEVSALYHGNAKELESWYADNASKVGGSPRASLLTMACDYAFYKVCKGVRMIFDSVLSAIIRESDPSYLPIIDIDPVWKSLDGAMLPYSQVPKAGGWLLTTKDVLKIAAYEIGVPYSAVLGWSNADKSSLLEGRTLARISDSVPRLEK